MTEEDRIAIGKEVRQKIRDAMAEYADMWESTTGSVVTSFVALAEVVRVNGDRAMIEVNADPVGDLSISSWTRDGLLFSALHDEWYRKSQRADDD